MGGTRREGCAGGTRSGKAPGQRLCPAHRRRLWPSRSPAVPAPLPCSLLTPVGMLGFLQPGTIPPRCHRGASARPGTSGPAACGGSAVPPPAPGTAPAAALPLLCSTASEAPRNKDFRRRRRGDPGLSPPRPRTLPAPAGLARPRPPPPPKPRPRCAGRARPCPAHVALPPPPRRPPPRVSCPAHPTPPPPPLRSAPASRCLAPRLAARAGAQRPHAAQPPAGTAPRRSAHTEPTRCAPSPPVPRNLRTLLLAHPSKLPLGTRLCCSAPAAPRASPPRHQLRSWLCRCRPAAQPSLRCPPRPVPCPGRAFLASRGAPQEEEPLPSGHS